VSVSWQPKDSSGANFMSAEVACCGGYTTPDTLTVPVESKFRLNDRKGSGFGYQLGSSESLAVGWELLASGIWAQREASEMRYRQYSNTKKR
jgi:hypothetical protein